MSSNIQRMLNSQLKRSLRPASLSSISAIRSSSSTQTCRTFTTSRFLRQNVNRAGPPPKKVSPHISFYQSYGVAMGKVMLMSMVIYQALYLVWVKAENANIRHELAINILDLEAKVKKLVVVKDEK